MLPRFSDCIFSVINSFTFIIINKQVLLFLMALSFLGLLRGSTGQDLTRQVRTAGLCVRLSSVAQFDMCVKDAMDVEDLVMADL